MKETQSHQTILETLNTFYNIKADKLDLVSGGADLNATAYKAQSGSSTFFVKVNREAHNPLVPTILKFLNSVGIQQIIQPIKTIHKHTAHQLGNSCLMVFPFVDGKNGFDCELNQFQWIALGSAFKQIHNMIIPPEIEGLIRKENYSSQWRSAVRSFYSEIERSSHIEIASNAVKFFIDHKSIILRLVDQAEQLSKEIQNLSTQYVLCHSDIHAGNVLISTTGEIYIVDWDSPILAPKERDLMFIGGGVAGVWNRPHEEELFYKGYGQTKANPTVLAYYRHERIIEDIAIYAQELVLAPSEKQDKSVIFKYLTDMFEPGNVVEIAFKTKSRNCP